MGARESGRSRPIFGRTVLSNNAPSIKYDTLKPQEYRRSEIEILVMRKNAICTIRPGIRR
jgi:hypothetical protein